MKLRNGETTNKEKKMKTEKEYSQYRIIGAASDNTPGYVLGYYTTYTQTIRAIAQYKGRYTSLTIQRKHPNGEYAN
jgi:hypothetical protein